MVGPFREAIVEESDTRPGESTRYLLHHGHNERRWADGAEIAWHDICPMAFDVAAGQPMLGYDATLHAFTPVYVKGPSGAGHTVRQATLAPATRPLPPAPRTLRRLAAHHSTIAPRM
jgi:hypothetical protein